MPQALSLLRDRVRRVLFRKTAVKHLFAKGAKDGEPLSEEGRIVLAWLKRHAAYGKPPQVKDAHGQTDLYQTGRMVGRQEVVQLLIEALHLDDRVLTNLQEEIPDDD